MQKWLSRLLGYVTGAFCVLATGGLVSVLDVANLARRLSPGTETASVTTWLFFWYLVALSLPFLVGGFLGYRYGRTKEATVASWIAVGPRVLTANALLGYVTGVVFVLATGFLVFQLYVIYVLHRWGAGTAASTAAISLFWSLVALSLPLFAGGFLGYRYGRRVERKKGGKTN